MSRNTKQVSETAKQIQSELFTLTYGVLVAQLLEDIEDTSVINSKLDKIGYNIGIRLIDDIFARNSSLTRCKDFQETAESIIKYGFQPYLNMIPRIDGWNEKKDEFSISLDNNILTEFVELNEISSFKESLVNPQDQANSTAEEIAQKNSVVSTLTNSSTNPGPANQNLDPSEISNALTELELDDNSVSTKGLNYCQLLCGCIRGALEMVQIQVQVHIIEDALRPKAGTEKPCTTLRVKFIRRIEEAIPVE